ncbi:MAG: acetyl-CoA carboxylase biotin carboxylase subunit [Alphaproteobacteria bacterium]
MFDTILIANRGEIACRIARTARAMGLRTVAVYSHADRNARHVALADAARAIGPAPAAGSYLDIDAILAAAKAEGADAIHPGYGFLAENADFAEACAKAGLVFIGPGVEAIRAMGSKSAAKNIMSKAGIPLIGGYHGRAQTPAALSKAADDIGYPVMLKASAGGGGKGMRIVRGKKDFKEALASAKREAKSGFGDDTMLIEKYIARSRHIEIQVFADRQGNAVHLFERDCSIQRRHQKIVEEAPAPHMTAGRRAEMGAAAVAAAKAIGYLGAGTVEFIVEPDGAFYFMEMNTRLQVEHPVTEMILGLDLVEWQIRVAAGQPLPLTQDRIAATGHAIEVRLYAEDPQRDFLPATGRLDHLAFPPESKHVRIDTGVGPGDEISIHYDPMIAKLVVWDRDRRAAIRRLSRALAATQIAGLTTNIRLLGDIARHPAFIEGKVDTGFIEQHRDRLFPPAQPASDSQLALAALDVVLAQAGAGAARAAASADPHSPWHRSDGWRLNDDAYSELQFIDGEAEVGVRVHYRPGFYLLDLPGGSVEASGTLDAAGRMTAEIDSAKYRVDVVRIGRELTIFAEDGSFTLGVVDALAAGADLEVVDGSLTAPMPGKIIAVSVKPGDSVTGGQALLVLEAMKMEHTIAAPADGTVIAIHYGQGEQVDEGSELIAFEADGEE